MIKLRAFQKGVSIIMEAQNQLKFKVFRNLPQLIIECRKLWRGFCALSKNH